MFNWFLIYKWEITYNYKKYCFLFISKKKPQLSDFLNRCMIWIDYLYLLNLNFWKKKINLVY